MEFTTSAELKKRMRADVLYNSDSSGCDSDDCLHYGQLLLNMNFSFKT